jgi:hypothetical protein
MIGHGPLPPLAHSFASRDSASRARCSSAIFASSASILARAISRARARSWLLSRCSNSAISSSVNPAACAERMKRNRRSSSGP